MKVEVEEIILRGDAISRGVAFGKPFVYHTINLHVPDHTISHKAVAVETLRFRGALEASRRDIARLIEQLRNEGAYEGVDILEAHLQILQDPSLTVGVEEKIRQCRRNASFVFHQVVAEQEQRFRSLHDPFFQERFRDVADVARRVQRHLLQESPQSLYDAPEGSIVFAEELAASDTAEVHSCAVGAFVTSAGSPTSHAAIVAKSKAIPYVANVPLKEVLHAPIEQVIVDGRRGVVIINPSPKTLCHYQNLCKDLLEQMLDLQKQTHYPPRTEDGMLVEVSVNCDSDRDLSEVHRHGAAGIGLVRSEYLFLINKRFPSEEEQVAAYQRIIRKAGKLPVVIRAFDLGGDKRLTTLDRPGPELNPYLGCRAMRLLLRRPDILRAQLRAILRAAVEGQVSLLLPMVSGITDVSLVRGMLEEEGRDLTRKGIPIAQSLPLGCMVELPATAVSTDLFVGKCDFLSLGTNDLVQYSLAVDRGSIEVRDHYTPTHPGVIRLIRMVVAEANQHNIPLNVCGEVAADPRFTALLLGLGVRKLSVAACQLPIVTNVVRRTRVVDAVELAEKALSLPTPEQIFDLLVDFYRESVPGDRLYNPDDPSVEGYVAADGECCGGV